MNRTLIEIEYKNNCSFSVQTNSPRAGRVCKAERGGPAVVHTGDGAVAFINVRVWDEIPEYARQCVRSITDHMQLETAVLAYNQCRAQGVADCIETCELRHLKYFQRHPSEVFHRLWGDLQDKMFSVSVKIVPYQTAYSMAAHSPKQRSDESQPVFYQSDFQSKLMEDLAEPNDGIDLSPEFKASLNAASLEASSRTESPRYESTPDTHDTSSDSSSSSDY